MLVELIEVVSVALWFNLCLLFVCCYGVREQRFSGPNPRTTKQPFEPNSSYDLLRLIERNWGGIPENYTPSGPVETFLDTSCYSEITNLL